MHAGCSAAAPAGRALLSILLTAVFAGPPGELKAAIYRWVDPSGREHFTTDLQQVPPRYRAAAEAAEKRSQGRMNIVGGGASPSEAQPAPAERRASPTGRQLEVPRPGGHDEAWWRAEYRRHVADVERAQRAVERANDITKYASYYGGTTRRERGRARNDAKRERAAAVARAQSQLQYAEKQLADFLETARRAGVPPGWVR